VTEPLVFAVASCMLRLRELGGKEPRCHWQTTHMPVSCCWRHQCRVHLHLRLHCRCHMVLALRARATDNTRAPRSGSRRLGHTRCMFSAGGHHLGRSKLLLLFGFMGHSVHTVAIEWCGPARLGSSASALGSRATTAVSLPLMYVCMYVRFCTKCQHSAQTI